MNVPAVVVLDGDVDAAFAARARSAGVVAWDIETSGLDWSSDRIATCQLHVDGEATAVVRIGDRTPIELCRLISDTTVIKVFHHAMFDLRFMAFSWNAKPTRICCTKIASKLLSRNADECVHRLASLLEAQLGVKIDKKEQTSNWLRADLTAKQLAYAVGDVIYLLPLLRRLEYQLKENGLLDLAHHCFEHIPARVQLELLRYPDVFTY